MDSKNTACNNVNETLHTRVQIVSGISVVVRAKDLIIEGAK